MAALPISTGSVGNRYGAEAKTVVLHVLDAVAAEHRTGVPLHPRNILKRTAYLTGVSVTQLKQWRQKRAADSGTTDEPAVEAKADG